MVGPLLGFQTWFNANNYKGSSVCFFVLSVLIAFVETRFNETKQILI